jgi:hypothetical protein
MHTFDRSFNTRPAQDPSTKHQAQYRIAGRTPRTYLTGVEERAVRHHTADKGEVEEDYGERL